MGIARFAVPQPFLLPQNGAGHVSCSDFAERTHSVMRATEAKCQAARDCHAGWGIIAREKCAVKAALTPHRSGCDLGSIS